MSKHKLLIVEDNPGDVDLVLDSLTAGAYDITVLNDGHAAIRYLRREAEYAAVHTPDLILLDLNLPKLGGVDVLAAMALNDDLRSIPTVVLTSSDAERDVADSYRLGANCYVRKPGDLHSYQAAVQAIEEFWFSAVRLP
ncbi:MAG: response regulator [Polyangiaceae bacterium]|nr:response regulator [Myxococcales bacterium]MCB9587572.1 response regulator [Polyangiaceae bacterium]MCB9605631.1 response regulator [Polyangiaceae bacterium]